jgi:tRNA(Arg) A34 adenosine deaminase TadA
VTSAQDVSARAYTAEDDRHLLAAIELSGHAAVAGNFPFAALLVDAADDVVVEAENTMLTMRDPTAHAEINLLRAASALFEPDYLAACTLYVSAEPCAMCAGAIYWGNVRRVVFGLHTAALSAVVGDAHEIPVLGLPSSEVFATCGHTIELVGPHREAESLEVHERFWQSFRERRLES